MKREKTMNILGNWEDFLPNETIELAKKLYKKAQQERNNGKILYPPQDLIFRAFNGINPEDVKVVIVGQDPYHEEGQANGLSFSVNKGCKLPSSLQNIYRELAIEFGWETSPEHGDLTAWEKQGVLLLNSTLTVYEGDANSCQKWGWDALTRDTLRACMMMPQPIVFLLWGRFAMETADSCMVWEEPAKHIIRTSHPSPLGVRKFGDGFVAFAGSGQFKNANEWLIGHNVKPINWMVE